MQSALVIGHTGGIGTAVTQALSAQNVQVTGLSRGTHGFDLRQPDTLDSALQAVNGPFDLVFMATGALTIDGAAPEKTIKALSPQAMADQFAVNAIGPAMALRHAPRLLPRNKHCIFAVLSARVGSIGDNQIGGWTSYRAAKAAVNQIIHTGAIELARTHPQAICVTLHPGTVETPFTQKYLGRHPAVPAPQAAANLLTVLDGLTPADTGQFFDYAGKRIPW
ncbi:MAG: SDR family NAD(P)-dependent oxidoreductase [Pseudomonadota bacterium]